jgi:hypothetical protein
MAEQWRDINDVGFSRGSSEEPALVTSAEEDEPEEAVSEVHLISAEWKPGHKGYLNNEQCFLEVKAEYLVETVRARIRGKLFGTYNDQEIDLAQEIVGFINKETGIARMEIKKLWFVNDEHYRAWKNDEDTPSHYIIKEITHSRGDNTIDSPVLDVPREISAFKFSC